VAEDELTSGTVAEEPAERERPHCAWKGVRGDRKPDEQAHFPGRGCLHGKPRDRDTAHPVAQGRDAEPREQPPCATVFE
jgi:hypothetical protein